MTYLDEILDRKRREVREASVDLDLAALRRTATPCTTDVLRALQRTDDRMRVIAEHKRASPSRGPIRPFHPGDGPDARTVPSAEAAFIARGYEAAGASAISVLTDEAGFDGRPADLQSVRAAVQIPVLCKDFIVSPIQVLLARSWGADLVLLIVAALSKSELKRLLALVRELGMTALVEVHDAHELAVASEVGARLIGVNNRSLHTFEVDLELSERLAKRFPEGAVRVSESGIRSPDDVRRMRDAGYDAVLVGERLMSEPDPGAALAALISQSQR